VSACTDDLWSAERPIAAACKDRHCHHSLLRTHPPTRPTLHPCWLRTLALAATHHACIYTYYIRIYMEYGVVLHTTSHVRDVWFDAPCDDEAALMGCVASASVCCFTRRHCDPLMIVLCMYVKIRRHQHTRVHAHTGPRRHIRAPACHRHHIPRLVRRQAFHTDHHSSPSLCDRPRGGGGGGQPKKIFGIRPAPPPHEGGWSPPRPPAPPP